MEIIRQTERALESLQGRDRYLEESGPGAFVLGRNASSFVLGRARHGACVAKEKEKVEVKPEAEEKNSRLGAKGRHGNNDGNVDCRLLGLLFGLWLKEEGQTRLRFGGYVLGT